MAYFAPYVDELGYHYPTYADILDYYIQQAYIIFGTDIYLGEDSQDYQSISIKALVDYNLMETQSLVYNNMSPATAVGTGLDTITKLNGLKRLSATQSYCPVVVSGTPFALISNGVISDANGVLWSLPVGTLIGAGGTSTVTATCQDFGAITAGIGTLTNIITPQLGWTSVTNLVSATLGLEIETDSQLRQRQATLVGLNNICLLSSFETALRNIPIVTDAKAYENGDSGLTIDAATIKVVADYTSNATNDQIVGEAVYEKKCPGILTDGTKTIAVAKYGKSIKLTLATKKDIAINLTLKAFSTLSSAELAQLKTDIQAFINQYKINDDVSRSALWGFVQTKNTNQQYPKFSVTDVQIGLFDPLGSTTNPTDFVIAWDEKAVMLLPTNVAIGIT